MSAEGSGDGNDAVMVESDEDNMIVDDDVEMAGNDADDSGAPTPAPVTQVWDPSRYELDENEELDYDSSAYKAMHELGVEWPCLSFDLVPDALGFMRKTWPQTIFMVAGSQAADPAANRISVMRIANITETKQKAKTGNGDDDDDDDDDDEDEEQAQARLPVVGARFIRQRAAVNRIRAMPQSGSMVASWSEDGTVSVHNVAPILRSMEDVNKQHDATPLDWKPVAQFAGHTTEGFAMAWSPLVEGLLVTGDCGGKIHLWEPEMVGAMRNWKVDTVPFLGHGGSVEDLVWSPKEARVFASSSVDHTIKLWDCRAANKGPVMSIAGHNDHVNVIAWNPMVTHLLASGCDDGVWKVHDLRAGVSEAFSFGFHKEPITSIDWCPYEDSMIAVSSSDDSLSVWDLSATRDDDHQEIDPIKDEFLDTVPEQLLFLHRGLFDPKELHWHKQVPGLIVATAANGFHLFAPENIVPK